MAEERGDTGAPKARLLKPAVIAAAVLALVVWRVITGASPRGAEAYYNRGVEYLDKGDYDRAIADC
ncbi:MAG: tetratricopeptide repeat protein, partial [Planctomycetota bacterium]